MTVAETIVADMLAAGHQVTVATTDVLDERRRLPLNAPAMPAGAEVVRFANVSHRPVASLNLYAPRGLAAWMRANVGRFDVALLNDVYSAVSVIAARAAVRAGVPFALQPFGTLSLAPERGRSLAKRAFLALWGRRTVATASALMYLGNHEAQDFLAAGGSSHQLVRMPLPLELPGPGPSGGLAPKPTVAFVGRLHPIKGLDRLLQATAIAVREVAELRLEIVGPGKGYRGVLERLAARLGIDRSVRFHGFVDIETKLEILRRSHVSALLSRSEGLPMAALEAMACGTPVVLSHGCHLDEIHEWAGLVTSDSAADAAAAIVRLLTEDGLRERLAAGAGEFAQQYRRERVMPEMIAALERLATDQAG